MGEEADLDVAYLTTTGRTSGIPHRIEIWFALHGSSVYLLAGGGDRADWVRNLLVSPTVILEIGGRRRTSRARVIEAGTDDEALARRLLFEKYSSRSTDDLSAWSRTALPVAVDWPA